MIGGEVGVEGSGGLRVLVAGASGVIGLRAVHLLVGAGHHVFALTRSAERAVMLCEAGALATVVDVYAREKLVETLCAVRPSVVLNQLTDLSGGLDPAATEATLARNARIRDEGARNLAAAAVQSGAERLVSQSIAWAYAPAATPHDETAPLDRYAVGHRAITLKGVMALEEATLRTAGLIGTVLRYGRVYGEDTGHAVPPAPPAVHVDAAAYAALLAVQSTLAGVYNVAEPNGEVSTVKVSTKLGWKPSFRMQAFHRRVTRAAG